MSTTVRGHETHRESTNRCRVWRERARRVWMSRPRERASVRNILFRDRTRHGQTHGPGWSHSGSQLPGAMLLSARPGIGAEPVALVKVHSRTLGQATATYLVATTISRWFDPTASMCEHSAVGSVSWGEGACVRPSVSSSSQWHAATQVGCARTSAGCARQRCAMSVPCNRARDAKEERRPTSPDCQAEERRARRHGACAGVRVRAALCRVRR